MKQSFCTPLKEVRDRMTPEKLEQDITDLEIDLIEKDQDMTDMDIRLTELEEKIGG
jgi:hypothetical protein